MEVPSIDNMINPREEGRCHANYEAQVEGGEEGRDARNDVGVQGRDAPQRIEDRPEGQGPPPGDRDRVEAVRPEPPLTPGEVETADASANANAQPCRDPIVV